MSFKRFGALPALLAFLILSIAACEGSHTMHTADSAATTELTPVAGEITFVDLFIRTVPLEGGNGAVYGTILNGTDTDVLLVGGESSRASDVQLHETVTENDIMRMLPLADGVEIPAGGSVTFAEGGKHIMLTSVTAPIAAGDRVDLTLNFADGQSIQVEGMASDSSDEEMGDHAGH